jgi:hypothetical protein
MACPAVIRVLERLFHAYGSLEFLRSDNGPEFILLDVKSWLSERRAGMTYIDPNCPCRTPMTRASTTSFAMNA